jgi:hypothetical protein
MRGRGRQFLAPILLRDSAPIHLLEDLIVHLREVSDISKAFIDLQSPFPSFLQCFCIFTRRRERELEQRGRVVEDIEVRVMRHWRDFAGAEASSWGRVAPIKDMAQALEEEYFHSDVSMKARSSPERLDAWDHEQGEISGLPTRHT